MIVEIITMQFSETENDAHQIRLSPQTTVTTTTTFTATNSTGSTSLAEVDNNFPSNPNNNSNNNYVNMDHQVQLTSEREEQVQTAANYREQKLFQKQSREKSSTNYDKLKSNNSVLDSNSHISNSSNNFNTDDSIKGDLNAKSTNNSETKYDENQALVNLTQNPPSFRRDSAQSTDKEEENGSLTTNCKNNKRPASSYGDLNITGPDGSGAVGEIIYVTLTKTNHTGLGLSLAGNRDRMKTSVFICGINPDGPAARDGKIRIGDEILEVNDVPIYGRCHLNASAIMKSLAGPTYNLVLLRRGERAIDDMAVKQVSTFPGNPASSAINDPSSISSTNEHQTDRIDVSNNLNVKGVKNDYQRLMSTLSVSTADFTPFNCGEVRDQRSSFSSINEESLLTRNDEDSRTRKIAVGALTTIELQRDKCGLGLSIVGGTDTPLTGIYIHEILPNGAADLDGRLQRGDRLLFINGQDLSACTHEQATALIQETPTVIGLTVFRERDLPIYDELVFELSRKQGKPLGIKLASFSRSKNSTSSSFRTSNAKNQAQQDQSQHNAIAAAAVATVAATTLLSTSNKNNNQMVDNENFDTVKAAELKKEIETKEKITKMEIKKKIISSNEEDSVRASEVNLSKISGQLDIANIETSQNKPNSNTGLKRDIKGKEREKIKMENLDLKKKQLLNPCDGVFVDQIIKFSHGCEQLTRGDQILKVNQHNLANATPEDAASVFRLAGCKLKLCVSRLRCTPISMP